MNFVNYWLFDLRMGLFDMRTMNCQFVVSFIVKSLKVNLSHWICYFF